MSDETCEEFGARLWFHFVHWMQPSNATLKAADVGQVLEAVVIDQFISTIADVDL